MLRHSRVVSDFGKMLISFKILRKMWLNNNTEYFNTESYLFKHLNNKTNDNKEAKDKNKNLIECKIQELP